MLLLYAVFPSHLMTYRQVTVVYVNASNNLQQSIFNGGSWKDSPIFPLSQKPDNNSKLSVSSVVIPRQPLYNFPSILSSFVTYQYNFSIAALSISPDTNLPQARHNPRDLAANFQGQESLSYIEEGFTCSVNNHYSTNSSQLYTHCYFGDNGALNNITLLSLLWKYDFGLLGTNATINATDIDNDDYGMHMFPPCKDVC